MSFVTSALRSGQAFALGSRRLALGVGALPESPFSPRHQFRGCVPSVLGPGNRASTATTAAVTPGEGGERGDQPRWKTYRVSGVGYKSKCVVSTDDGFELVTDTPAAMGGTNEAAQPVLLLLSALAGCETATAQFVARQMRIRLREIRFELQAWRDQRGALKLPLEAIDGYEVPSHLQVIDGEAVVDTDATQEQIDFLSHQVHRRCPIASMLSASGCRVNIRWVAKAS